jgi:hypothetical protein
MVSASLKQYRPEMNEISYRRHRFPAAIIQHAVWLYFRFTLSYRDVEDLLAERGIDVSYETVRRWALKFGHNLTILQLYVMIGLTHPNQEAAVPLCTLKRT